MINHTCPYNGLPTGLDTQVLKLISSFRCIVASVEEPYFQQFLWDTCLSAYRLVEAVPSQCWARSMLFPVTWWTLAALSSATAAVKQRKRKQGLFMRCASKSRSFFHDKASALTFCFLDAKGKWKGRIKGRIKKRGPVGRAEREALHPSIFFQDGVAGHHHF